MDISKIEKSSPSSNRYDDLRSKDSLSSPKIPTRSTSTIGYISPREIENTQIQRPTVSLILPTTSTEQMITLDTILSIDDIKQQSLSVESIEKKNKNLITNKVDNLISKEQNQSCVCWIVHEIIHLICIALFAFLITMFVFILIFYAFDNYWLEQPMVNNSLWWFYDNNYTNFDYNIINTTSMINYDDEY